MDVLPAALTWIAKDATVCSIENGVLKGLKNGQTKIYGSLGSFKDSLLVKVEIPENGTYTADDFRSTGWNLDASAALNAVFNTQNLPSNWTTGSAVNFVFNTTRAPYIKLTKNINLYSLPDTFKITVNAGNISISKLLISLKTANSTSDVTKEFTVIPKNNDVEIAIPIASMFSTNDISIYPIKLNYLNFYLNAQTNGQAYSLALKDITLCYKNYTISGLAQMESKGMSIFPNPANNKQLTIRLNESISGDLKLSFFATNGRMVYTTNFKNQAQNEYKVTVDNLKSGIYIVHAYYDKQQLSSTVLISAPNSYPSH
jgi:hypothetical protein